MTRGTRAAVLLAVAALAGCTADDSAASSPPSSSSPSSSSPSTSGQAAADSSPPVPPPLAGPSQAAAVAPLPDGAAGGSIVLTYSGLGEVREPFTGTCRQDGTATRLAGTASGAVVDLLFDADGASLRIEDVGVESSARLSAGEVTVDGDRLRLHADLVAAEQVIGEVYLDVTCS